MADAVIRWQGVDTMVRNCTIYADKVRMAVKAVLDYFAPVFETFSKTNGSWVDRTGNLRQTLHSWVEELSEDITCLYLAHGMSYGIFIETKYASRYSVLWPTIQAHLDQIGKMLQGIFN